ncbi:ABC transporter permease subunit [Orbaceae bacterium ac157xtp]
MSDFILKIYRSLIAFKNSIHHNLFMIIGFYGLLFILIICFSAERFFHAELTPSLNILLPPAWRIDGELNYILGTDKDGVDVFSYLLIAYKTSLLLIIKATLYVIILATILNYIMFFVAPIRTIINTIFKLIIAIPPLISAIIITSLFGNNIDYLLVVISLSYLPRFVIRIHKILMQERQKTYITANLLDGVPLHKTLYRYIFPNILIIYLTEIVALFGYIMLVLTILTFLNFGTTILNPDLGMMMRHMLTIFTINSWGFIAPGLAIIITLLLINLLNVGLQIVLTNRNGN